MKKILVAGATGYLGEYLVKELISREYQVRALSRTSSKAAKLEEFTDDTFIGEVTSPETLEGVCEGVDAVISSIGITRQQDGCTYMDVDYQGNKNLLEEALKHKVQKFIYVSVLNADRMMNLKAIQAKEKFVEELKNSGLDYSIMRPTGFFSDMKEFLEMAKKGTVSLFGNGENHINPIHGADLAIECVNALHRPEKEINIGGPETYTYKKIAELAFTVLKKDSKISFMPVWMIKIILPFFRAFASSRKYGPLEFMMTVMTMDVVGEAYGKEKLSIFFAENVDPV